MKIFIQKIIAAAFALMLISGCTEKEIIQVGLPGTLKGTVHSYGNSSNAEISQAGVKVTIEGTEPEISVMTDDEGTFSVDLKTGTYDLVFSREGFGTHKMVGFTFVGGIEPTNVLSVIYELPNFKIVDLELEIDPYYYQKPRVEGFLYVDLPDEEEYFSGFVRYYLHNNADVSYNDYLETGVVHVSMNPSYSSFSLEIDTDIFPRGTDLYCIAYPISDSYLNYIDVNTGNLIYSSVLLTNSKIASVTVPEE